MSRDDKNCENDTGEVRRSLPCWRNKQWWIRKKQIKIQDVADEMSELISEMRW